MNPALLKKKLRYLLRASFSTDIAAPLPASLPVDLGGPLTVVDTNGIMSQSGGLFVINGGAAADDRLITPIVVVRAVGRAFLYELPTRTTMGSGFRHGMLPVPSGVLEYGFHAVAGGTQQTLVTAGTVIEAVTLGAGVHGFLFVLKTTGAFLFARGAASGPYTLLWVYNTGSSDLYGRARSGAVTISVTTDNWRLLDLGRTDARFATSEGYATARIATNLANDQIAQTADAWVEQTLTAATGVDKDLYVRWVDDNNTWIVRQNQAGSTVNLIEKVAGVETSRGSVATTYTDTTAYRHVAICEASVIKVYVDTVLKITYSSASFQATATTAKAPSAGTEFKSYPRTILLRGDVQ